MDSEKKPPVKIKLVEINSHLTCPLCKGYFIDATTISECLHSFCRSCIIKFLHENSYCPVCELIINKAKPNLKLDKTLQDIVYKLVPELFLNEMKRRQWFYRSYPELAAKVTPEEKGEDTERTIFNPRDTISLSIEYISDDSTPGVIAMSQLISKGANCNNKNKTLPDDDENSAIRRFLQCPGMCRIDVLKKFICNKYNVDTNQFYIDILYKRVPLPDHYTLIDVAYIYSWKRNEPMKFFFKITDINLVTDSFDYLIRPQIAHTIAESILKTPCEQKIRKSPEIDSGQKNDALKPKPNLQCTPETKLKPHLICANSINSSIPNKINTSCNAGLFQSTPLASPRTNKDDTTIGTCQKPKNEANLMKVKVNTSSPRSKLDSNFCKKDMNNSKISKSVSEKIDMVRIQKEAIEHFKKHEKRKEFTNVTLDRNNHLEIVTKIHKVSNKNGLQIGIKITNQTFKEGQSPKIVNSSEIERCGDQEMSERLSNVTISPDASDVDVEKSNFLKSIELTAKHVIQAMVPQTLELPKYSNKRKNSSPVRTKKCSKKPKKYVNIQPKAIQNPAIWQIVSNVNQNVSNLSKIVEQMTPNATKSTNSDLQALLYDSYKINIPSSLSVTVKNDNDTCSPSYQKPVQNYIEILKLPDAPAPLSNKIEPICDELKSNSALNKVEIKSEPITPDVERKLLPQACFLDTATIKGEHKGEDTHTLNAVIPPKPVDSTKRENLSSPISQTFQNMFEETLKKTDVSVTSSKTPENGEQKSALNLSTNTDASGKRSLMEITSKLHKKTKLDHEKLLGAKSNPPLKDFDSYISQQKTNTQTISNLHSSKLGMNYAVSVTQDASSSDKPSHIESKLNGFPKIETVKSPKKTSLPRTPITTPKKASTVLNIPQKYNTDHKEVTSTSPNKLNKHNSPSASTDKDQLNPDQLLEKYNIQNLAQLTANFNFPPNLLSSTANQLAAFRQAMIYKHFEMQNHQNWVNMNPSPLIQYEKYLKSFSKSST